MAEAQGFAGTILLGQADGSYRVATVGTSALREDAVWRWASITKQLVAVIAMQEVARGKLDLSAPVTRYWPDWNAPHGGEIRVYDLLKHESGLPDPDESPRDPDGVPNFYTSALAAPQIAAARYCAGKPAGPPRKAYVYNNCDAIVLGEVLRRITGKALPALLEERIARPLALRSLGVYRVGKPRPPDHVRPIGEGAARDPLIDLGAYGAAGSAYGTIADLWRFDHALMTGKLLAAPEREVLWASTMKGGWRALFQWTYPVRFEACDAPVRVVERQGLVQGVELRNYLLPQSNQAVILFGNKRPLRFGQPWEGKGLAHNLIAKVACP
ncbi:hypothetical protein B2G71_09120 [Novosphingobium sp. PC22D]|nr:hypothetical protein B2G71_09120 [Novosphingobium sp. PC22D]